MSLHASTSAHASTCMPERLDKWPVATSTRLDKWPLATSARLDKWPLDKWPITAQRLDKWPLDSGRLDKWPFAVAG